MTSYFQHTHMKKISMPMHHAQKVGQSVTCQFVHYKIIRFYWHIYSIPKSILASTSFWAASVSVVSCWTSCSTRLLNTSLSGSVSAVKNENLQLM